MRVLHPKCAGLDVHSRMIVAAIRISGRPRLRREHRTFEATSKGLTELRDWLLANGCTDVLMEASGVFWKPVWHVLEGHFELTLARASDVRNLPGRKSDVNDATWLADLLAHGLVRSSFVPPPEIQRIRDLTRTRKKLMEQSTRHVNRVHKVLEDANIKLRSVISDVTGRSGRAVLEGLCAGERDPVRLQGLVSDRVKASRTEILEALRGKFTDHHAFMIRLHLTEYDMTLQHVAQIDERLKIEAAPFRRQLELMVTAPGIGVQSAIAILGEIGNEMEQFPSADHLVSWAGLCPKLDESASKIRSRRRRKGNRWLTTVMVQCAWAAINVKDSPERALFARIKRRADAKRAIVAVAASLLRSLYFMLKNQQAYAAVHAAAPDPEREAIRLAARIRSLGFKVTFEPAA